MTAAAPQLDQFGGTGSKLGKLNAPAQMTLDPAGNLWVADRGNNRVQQFGPGRRAPAHASAAAASATASSSTRPASASTATAS